MTEHVGWDELAAGYALDCLEPADEEAFLRHLRGCAACERTLAEMRAVTGQLAYASEPAGPPAALRESILAAAGTTGRSADLAPAGAGSRPRRGVRSLPAPWLLAAAAVAGVLVLGLWNASLRLDADRKDAVLALRRQYERMALDPDATATLVAPDGARASALVKDGRAMLLVDGLPESHPSPVMYVVWVLDADGRPHALEPFEVANDGEPNLIPAMALPVPLSEVSALAVSKESGPTVPTTPTTVLMSGAVRRDA